MYVCIYVGGYMYIYIYIYGMVWYGMVSGLEASGLMI